MLTVDPSGPLAAFVPVLGTASETFVRRHVECLQPSNTVVVARRMATPGPGCWTSDAPTLLLDELEDEWGGERERAAVSSFLRGHGVRSVLLEFLDIWLPFVPTVRDLGLRCVAHAHGYDVSARLRDEYWRSAYLAYRDIAAVVTMSQFTKARLLQLGLPAERVAVVPYGVDLVPQIARPRRSPVHVLVVGRLVAKKHPVATIQACDLAAQRGADLRVTVIGDGPLLPQVQAAANEAAVPVEVLRARSHPEVLQMMSTADVFCQHSVVDAETGDEEGVPVAILEAMAHGLPVVSTRHAGIPEAVADGITGLLADEGDVDAMAEQIQRMAADRALRERLGASGRARVGALFSWDAEQRALRRLLRLEDDIVEAGGRGL